MTFCFRRREKKSVKIESEDEIQEMLEHFCTSLHGFVGGAFRIEIIEFSPSSTDFCSKLTVKIPYE